MAPSTRTALSDTAVGDTLSRESLSKAASWDMPSGSQIRTVPMGVPFEPLLLALYTEGGFAAVELFTGEAEELVDGADGQVPAG